MSIPLRSATLAIVAAVFLATAAHAASTVRTLRVPDGGIHPQAATDSKGRLHLLYVKGEPMNADAFYVRSDDGGTTFTALIRVNSQPGSVVVTGTVRGPHLAIGRGDRVHAAWMGSGKAEPKSGKAAPMLYTRLNDAGDAFEPQRNVGAGHPGLDGGGSVAADTAGNVYVAWHAPAEYGKSEGEQARHVYVTRSADDGKTFAAEVQADPRLLGVCACCGMRVFCSGKGRVFVLYRCANEAIHRDVQLLVSDDAGRSFRTAVSDPWEIATCAMSTAALTEGKDAAVTAAWETAGQIHVGVIADGGTKPALQWTAPGTSKTRKHPSIAVNADGHTLLTWAEGTGWNKGGTLHWQVFDPAGKPVANQSGRAAGIPVWGVPAAVTLRDGTFLIVY